MGLGPGRGKDQERPLAESLDCGTGVRQALISANELHHRYIAALLHYSGNKQVTSLSPIVKVKQ